MFVYRDVLLSKENVLEIAAMSHKSVFELESEIRFDFGHNQSRTYHFVGTMARDVVDELIHMEHPLDGALLCNSSLPNRKLTNKLTDVYCIHCRYIYMTQWPLQ